MSGRDASGRARTFLDSIDLDLDPDLRIKDPVVAEAHSAWNRLRGDRAMPAPSDLDVLDLPRPLLPHLLLLDGEHEPVLRFRWRPIGTHTAAALGRDGTTVDRILIATVYRMH